MYKAKRTTLHHQYYHQNQDYQHAHHNIHNIDVFHGAAIDEIYSKYVFDQHADTRDYDDNTDDDTGEGEWWTEEEYIDGFY